MSKFFILKSVTNETIFSEVMSATEYVITLYDPIVVELNVSDTSEMLSGSAWIPFTDDKLIPMPLSSFFYVGLLSSTYIKFYGSVVSQKEINKIKRDSHSKLTGDLSSDYMILTESLIQLKTLNEDLMKRFNINISDSIKEYEESMSKITKPLAH